MSWTSPPRLTGWMWCGTCKAFRWVNGDPTCWRCGWDMRAEVGSPYANMAEYRRRMGEEAP